MIWQAGDKTQMKNYFKKYINMLQDTLCDVFNDEFSFCYRNILTDEHNQEYHSETNLKLNRMNQDEKEYRRADPKEKDC